MTHVAPEADTDPSPGASAPIDPMSEQEGSTAGVRSRSAGFVRGTGFSLTARWLFVTGFSLLAFWPSVVKTVEDIRDGDSLGYIFVMPFLAVVAAIGIARRRSGELPIHDRQTDGIVGGLCLLVAVAVKWLLVPRYVEEFDLLRIDLLSWLLFVLGAAVLLFGLRPVGRFWPVWLLSLLIAPLPYRMTVVALGGQSQHVGIVLILLAAIATAIAVGRTRRRGVIGGAATVVVGGAVSALLWLAFPDVPRIVVQFLPAAVGAVLVGAAVYFIQGYYFTDGKGGFSVAPQRPPAVRKGLLRPGLVVGAVACGLALVPLPDPPQTVVAQGPPQEGTLLVVPDGWSQEQVEGFDWADRFFGRDASLVRQTLVADEGNPDWDAQSRPRRVVVDTLGTYRPATLTVYPTDTLYQLKSARTSPVVPVDLGYGVEGRLSTIVDDQALLTWSLLTFTWTRGEQTERVNLITVDDHRPDALFPQLTPSMASEVTSTLNVLVRGNAVTVDETSEYKDRDMLTILGSELVAAQWQDAAQ